MRISDWSSDVCSSDLVSSRRSTPSTEQCSSWSTCRPPRSSSCANSSPKMRGASLRARDKEFEALTDDETERIEGMYADNFGAPLRRSEEHTSELQSLMRISYAVFCLKKKTKHKTKSTSKN